MAKYTLSKFDSFKIRYAPIIIPVVVVVFMVIMFAVMLANGGDRTPSSASDVQSKLTELGYETVDATAEYENKIQGLEACICLQKNDIVFYFMDLKYEETAEALFSSYVSQINMKGKYNSWNDYHDNYWRHSVLSFDNTRYECIRIADTVLYAQCDDENKQELFNIINAINYNSSDNEDKG